MLNLDSVYAYDHQRTVPGYAGVRGSATNNATVTVNGNTAWRLGEYFYGGDDANNAASAVMKELDITAVVNPPGTNDADIVQSVTGKVFVAKSPEAFTYDDDGNILSDGRFVYSWDGENRLVSVETSAAAASAGVSRVKVAYTYDNRSRRIGKEVSHFENDTWTVAESRSFVYDGWNMVQEFSTLNSQLSILNSYVWGLDLSGSLQGAGGVGGLLAVAQGSTVYLPCYDGNGNVCEYSSADGTLVAHYEYSPFGETVVKSGDLANTFAFRFSTKYWENEAKLYYYGYRFYAPGVGRWLNRDPIGEWGGKNIYVFVANRVFDLFDVLGQASSECQNAMNAFLGRNPKYQQLIDYLKKEDNIYGECIYNFTPIDCCKGDNRGEFFPGGKAGMAKQGTIVLCCNNSDNYQQTIAHELTHFIDYCRRPSKCGDMKSGTDEYFRCMCEERIMGELRAHANAGQCTEGDFESCWRLIKEKGYLKNTVGCGDYPEQGLKLKLKNNMEWPGFPSPNYPPAP